MFDERQQLGHTEQPDHHDQKVDACQNIRQPKSIARNAGVGVDADGGQHQTDGGSEHRFDSAFADQRGQRSKGKDHQRHIIGRRECHRKGGQRRREERHQDHCESAADERRDGRERQGTPGQPGPGHWVAVERGHHRARVAGHVQQDRGNPPAVFGTVVDACQQDQRRFRAKAQPVGDGQQNGHAIDWPQPRQCADQGASKTARKDEKEVKRVERHAKARGKAGQNSFHQELSFSKVSAIAS